MTTIKDLLHEVTDAVEPGDRLDAIRAATAQGGRRTHRGWWAAGGAGLVAASVVTALALSTGGGPGESLPGPAQESTGTATTSATENPNTSRVVPIYFVGETPTGPRLFRELQRGTGPMSAETFALDAALSGASLDPDYRTPWPAGAVSEAYGMTENLISVTIMGDLHDRPPGMSEEEARLAIEQVVRTAQGVWGHGRVPVELRLNGATSDQILGVPTSEPLSTSPDLDVLSHVNLSDPVEGQVVDNDEPLTVRGVGASADDRVSLSIRQWDGPAVLYQLDVDLEPSDAQLAPFSVKWSLGSRPPGDYEVVVTVTDADGTVDTDTRRITVVD
ncbi:GerMN domain-containing protein [Nocardioides KLBMP 9356]|uniref:GerMN domain-containing protein n=1 Tax=Nocardioides potassii TaxID=2911371 RepID=A0ABS9HHL3_9ACTN|nr:GerMN domain-containing protein [Nocardioides potassii]MCF6379613.1 GerMN domain-containing protein [Nocardioides potassii]